MSSILAVNGKCPDGWLASGGVCYQGFNKAAAVSSVAYQGRPQPVNGKCPDGWWASGSVCYQGCPRNDQWRDGQGMCTCLGNFKCASGLACVNGFCRKLLPTDKASCEATDSRFWDGKNCYPKCTSSLVATNWQGYCYNPENNVMYSTYCDPGRGDKCDKPASMVRDGVNYYTRQTQTAADAKIIKPHACGSTMEKSDMTGYCYSSSRKSMYSTFCVPDKGDNCSQPALVEGGKSYWFRSGGRDDTHMGADPLKPRSR